MRIQNLSRHDTATLRRIIILAHRDLARSEGRLPQWGSVTIRIRPRRALRRRPANPCDTSGWAYLGGRLANLRVPEPQVSTRFLYDLAWHEILHLYGYRHNQGLHPVPELRDRALAGLPEVIEVPPPAPRVPVDIKAVRYAKVVRAIARWTTKLRRAQTALRRLNGQRRRYERLIPQAAQAPKEER